MRKTVCTASKSFAFVAGLSLLITAVACDGNRPPALNPLPPSGGQETPGANNNGDSNTPNEQTTSETKSDSAPKAVLYQAENGPSALPNPPVWNPGEVNEFEAHYLEGFSIPYRVVMEGLPTDGTQVDVQIGYQVKHGGKYAIAYLTHYQRLEPHTLTMSHNAEVVNPLVGVEDVPTVADTIPIPAPRSSVPIDCLPGNKMQPASSFAGLSDGERVMSLFGGQLDAIDYVGDAPDLSQDTATEHVKITFTPNSSTAVLAWGGYIASEEEFGCSANDVKTARGMMDSPYVTELEKWSLSEIETQNIGLRGQSVIDPDLYCFVDGPMEVCPNATETSYSVNIEGECETPAFVEWTVLGDAEIVGPNDEETVYVNAESSGTYLVFATAFCADCTGCVPLFCCKIVDIVPPPEADAGPDDASCPAGSGETCFDLNGTGSNGTPSWSVVTQPADCNVTIENGDTFTPSVCFPEDCSGSATLRLSVEGECGTAVDDVTLTVYPQSTADAGDDQSECPVANLPTCFTLSGNGTNGSPTWTVTSEPEPGSVTIVAANTFAPTVCFDAGVTGTATIQLTVAGDPECPASDAVELTVVEQPTAEAGPPQTLCQVQGDETCFSLEGSGSNGTPSWSVVTQPVDCNVTMTDGDTFTPTVCFPAGCSGSVIVRLTVTGAGECAPATDETELVVVPAPTADAGPDDDSCPALTGPTCFDLNGGGTNGTPSWSVVSEPSPGTVTIIGGNTFTPSVCFDEGVNGTATIRLTVTGLPPCTEATDDVTLTVGPSDLSCAIDSPTMAGIVTGSVTGGVAPFTCSAEFNTDGWFVTSCDVMGDQIEVTYERDGGICTPIPTITVTIIDAEGCTTQCFVEVPCPQGCTANSKIACDCPHNPITICAMPSGGLPPFSYEWSGPMGTSNMMCYMVDTPGIYTSTVTDGNGLSETCCSAVVDSMISGPSPCPGATGLTYEVNYNLPGGTFTPSSYSWSISGNGSFCGATDGSSVCVDAGEPGVFTLVVETTGTVTFECEGTTETVPVTGTCALAYVVEDTNCGGD